MSKLLLLFVWILLLTIRSAVSLSVWSGVGGCEWFISISAVQYTNPFCALINNDPSSHSAADPITGFITEHSSSIDA